MTFEK